jgi:hypothetical protein
LKQLPKPTQRRNSNIKCLHSSLLKNESFWDSMKNPFGQITKQPLKMAWHNPVLRSFVRTELFQTIFVRTEISFKQLSFELSSYKQLSSELSFFKHFLFEQSYFKKILFEQSYFKQFLFEHSSFKIIFVRPELFPSIFVRIELFPTCFVRPELLPISFVRKDCQDCPIRKSNIRRKLRAKKSSRTCDDWRRCLDISTPRKQLTRVRISPGYPFSGNKLQCMYIVYNW